LPSNVTGFPLNVTFAIVNPPFFYQKVCTVSMIEGTEMECNKKAFICRKILNYTLPSFPQGGIPLVKGGDFVFSS
jgi:hypothetical protein